MVSCPDSERKHTVDSEREEDGRTFSRKEIIWIKWNVIMFRLQPAGTL